MPVVKFDVQGAGKVPAEHKKIADAQEKVNKAVKAGGQTYKFTAKEAQKFGRIAQRIARDSETAQERYTRKLGESKRALAGVTNGSELLKRETVRLKDEYIRTTRKAQEFETKGKASFNNLATEQKNFSEKIGVTKKAYEEAGDAGKGAFGTAALSRLALLGAGYLSFSKIVSAVTQEIRDQQEFVDKATATQLTVSESQTALARNTTSLTPDQRKKFSKGLEDISRETGVSIVAINLAGADAISAGTGEVGPALSAVAIGAKSLLDQPQNIPRRVGVLQDLSQVTGSKDALVRFHDWSGAN